MNIAKRGIPAESGIAVLLIGVVFVFVTLYGFAKYYTNRNASISQKDYVEVKAPDTEKISSLNIDPSSTKIWKSYSNTAYKYSFKYPETWGIGKTCEHEDLVGLVKIGPEFVKYPTANCGTANIAPPIFFYVEKAPKMSYPNYSVTEKKTIRVGSKDGEYQSFKIVDRNQAGSNTFQQFLVPLNGNEYLVAMTGSYDALALASDFLGVISTLNISGN